MTAATIRPAADADVPAITAIYNDAITATTAVWNDDPVDAEERQRWLAARRAQGYPVLVAVLAGKVVGYGSFGDFRGFQGYRLTVEHSLYVVAGARRQGVAGALLDGLTVRARTLGKHVMVAGIAADNAPSLAFHLKHGFVETGRMPEVGTKFGHWLDLVLMQKAL